MIKYEIGKKLKQIRAEAEWSLSRAAEETGVSKAMLGQIERNESSPTIATLWKIATGFHKPLSLLIDDSVVHDDDGEIHKKEDQLKEQNEENDLNVSTLFPFDPRFGFEVFLISLKPAQTHESEAHDSGVFEHILVTEGEMEIKLEGKWKTLSEGDVIRFKANQAHSYRNTKKDSATKFHNIIYYT